MSSVGWGTCEGDDGTVLDALVKLSVADPEHWPEQVIVNVDSPIEQLWIGLLGEYGFEVSDVVPAYTKRYGGLDNADKRAKYEVVIVAARG